MSYDQDLEKFAGTSRDFCHYDEEPPRHIYNESQARLIDVNGYAWLTMTPVDGMTWVFYELYTPGTSGLDPDIAVVEVDMGENTYLTEEARRRYLRTLDPDERAAREHGHFMQMGGLVFKNFSRELHVVSDFVPPKNWEHYTSVDHGYNNPTAWLWHAVSPDGEVVTYSEHYASEMLVSQHANIVHMREAGLGRIPDMRVCDPALAQRQGVTGDSIIEEYAKHGLYLMPGNNDVPTGVNKMNQYLKPDHNGVVRWHITESCVNLIREMKLLRWATFASKKMQYENNKQEKIHKKDDHAPDSARYFFTFMPDLSPDSPPATGLIRTPNPEGSVGGKLLGGSYDPALSRPRKSKYEIFEGTDLYAMEFE
jgi:phage terminase large subunit-like protein